jgi:hypothetical protein
MQNKTLFSTYRKSCISLKTDEVTAKDPNAHARNRGDSHSVRNSIQRTGQRLPQYIWRFSWWVHGIFNMAIDTPNVNKPFRGEQSTLRFIMQPKNRLHATYECAMFYFLVWDWLQIRWLVSILGRNTSETNTSCQISSVISMADIMISILGLVLEFS